MGRKKEDHRGIMLANWSAVCILLTAATLAPTIAFGQDAWQQGVSWRTALGVVFAIAALVFGWLTVKLIRTKIREYGDWPY